MERNKYDVFISYSRKDYIDEKRNIIPGNEVSRIKEALTKAGLNYWFDEEGIYSGNEFTEKIVSNIEASSIFLFLSTKNANASDMTSREIACADELKKHIIPVRIDLTPYNKKVLFRIADLSYIDYNANPEKGLNEIVMSIRKYKEQGEAEKKRIIKEQEKLVASIKVSSMTLNNEEAKLELDRKNLLLKIEEITDKNLQDLLKAEISAGGPIHRQYQNELITLTDEVNNLKQYVVKLEKEICVLRKKKIKESFLKTIKNFFIRDSQEKEGKTSVWKNQKTYSIYIPSISVLVFLIGILVFHKTYEFSTYWIEEPTLILYGVGVFLFLLFVYYWIIYKHARKSNSTEL